MSLFDRTNTLSKESPSSLLPPERARPRKDADLPKQSPSSLLPPEPGRARGSEPEQLSQHGPSSLLPETPGADVAPAAPELAKISPEELLPPAPQRTSPIPWRKVTIAGAILLLVVFGLKLSTRVNLKSTDALMQEAIGHLDKGDRIAAIIQLKNALQSDPNHVEARLLHGTLALEGGDIKGAEEDFRRAHQLGGSREVVMPLLARALIARKEYQEALDATAPPPDRDPAKESPALIAQRGHALFFLGRNEQAREAYDYAHQSDPEQPDALLGEARLAVVERKQDLALQKLELAVAKAPRNADALALLGDMKRVAGDEAAAAAAYEKAVAIAPKAHNTRLSLASVYVGSKEYDKAIVQLKAVVKDAPDSPTANFLWAMVEFRREKYEDARNLAAKVLNVQGNHVPSLLMVGASAFLTRDYVIAEKALRRALVLAPRNVYARKVLGASLVRIKQPRLAVEELLPLLNRFPDDRDLLATLGEAFLDLSDFNRATDLLEKAAALAPKDPAARIGLGRTRLAAGELDRALADLEAATALAPQAREAKLLLAMTHLRRREFDLAMAIIGEIEPKARNNPVALNLLGAASVGKKDFAAATKYFEQALAVSPSYMPSVMNLVQIDLRERDSRAAIRRLETVIKHSPNNMQAMLALAAILAGTKDGQEEALRWIERAQQANPDSVEPLLRLARFHLGRGSTREALDAAARALQANITTAEMLDALGQVQLNARSSRQALDTYVRMVSENPEMPLAHLRLAAVQQLVGNSAGARQSLRNALRLKKDYVEAKLQLAQLEVRAGNTAVALGLAEDLIRQLPKSSIGYSVKGDVLVHSRRFAEAIPVFEAAFARQRASVFVLKLHQAEALAGRIERGEKVVEDWLRESPNDLTTRLFVADYSLSVKRYQVARRHYEALVAAMPKNQQVLNNLAIVYDELKDPRALEFADRAYHLNTRNPYVADTYGWMLVRLGRPERGRDILREAIKVAPSIPDLRYHHAVALAKSGQRKEARGELERAFSLPGKVTQEADAKALLEQLRN
ncbi:MAG: PEP-CTERM system TPR-repeat protein PrsT [Betaproteobacteria bacterium]|nr:MAG: PEP-CTERM system TPR-repeat protein PrsT [Betaproteobacteria bacterium]